MAILNAQRSHVESLKVFSMEKLSKDATTRDIKIDSYGQVVDFVSNTLRKTAQARRQAQAQREQLLPEIDSGDLG